MSDNRKSKIQNRKWAGLFAIVLALTMCGAAASAQQPQKIPRLGYLSYGSVEIDKGLLAALQQGLRELGYLEGRNIVIEQR